MITRLTVRLHPLPESAASVQVAFPDVAAAVEAAVAVQGAGLVPQRLELVDRATIAAVNAFKEREDREDPTLWIEVVGRDAADVAAQLELVEELCREAGGEVAGRATTPREREELWTARHHVFYALRALFPGHRYRVGDLCVPSPPFRPPSGKRSGC